MNSFAINFLVFLFVGALATLGWFGLQQLERGTEYVVLEQGEELPEPEIEEEVVLEEEDSEAIEEPEMSEEISSLIAELQGLINDKVVMKEGSSGALVGIVQRFLNNFFERTDSIDNSYGPGTSARIRDFQKSQGLTADGQSGPNTYRKMIEVLQE